MDKLKYILTIPLLVFCVACDTSQSNKLENKIDKSSVQKIQKTTKTNEPEHNMKDSQTEESISKNSTMTSEVEITKSSPTQWTEIDWTPQKMNQLEEYMVSFGKSMGQYYKSYRLENNELMYNDLAKEIYWSLPTDVFAGNAKAGVRLNDKTIGAAWYTIDFAKKTADFVIYALFSDVGQVNLESNHTYVFGIYHNKPIVAMIDEKLSRNTLVVLNTTKNENLMNTFDSIFKGTEYNLEIENRMLDANLLAEKRALEIGRKFHPKDSGVSLSYDHNIKEDNYGRFVQLHLVVQNWREAGGSGTAGFMRIYENGIVLDNQLPVND